MDETTGQIEQHINRQRENLGQNIDELQTKVKNAVDWRMRVREHPLTMVGIAFGAGVVASVLVDGRGNGEGNHGGYARPIRVKRMVRREWDVVKAAVGAAVLGEAKDFVRQMFPRFGQEYEKREHGGSARGNYDEPTEWTTGEPGTEEL
jgi:hypothetical protein